MQIAMIQDKIVPFAELESVYLDRGTYFGDGVYEVVRSYAGRIFALEEHLQRFSHSLSEIGIAGVDIADVRAKVQLSFSQAGISDAKIYFHITRGSAVRNHAAGGKLEPNFFLTVTEIPDMRSEKECGIAVSTHADWRWKRCDIKSLNLLANVLARMDAERKGCSEAILVNENGQITEGAGSALFAVWAGERKVQTRGLGCEILASITRQVVLQLAPAVGLEVVEEALRPDDAKRADELFIAVTTKGIVGVVEFDGVKIGAGEPGEYTKILTAEFEQLVRKKVSDPNGGALSNTPCDFKTQNIVFRLK